MSILNTQLPSTSPIAILGTLIIVTALMPVMSSGKEVIDASIMKPTHVRPNPVFSAIISPYLESRDPE